MGRKRRTTPGPRLGSTYEASTRVAQVAFELTEPHRVMAVDEIAARYEVNTRTAQRDLVALRLNLFNGLSHPSILHLEDRDGREHEINPDLPVKDNRPSRVERAWLTSAREYESPESASRRVMPVYAAFTMLRFLDGIVPREDIRDLWRQLIERVNPDESLRFTDFERKFFAVPYAPKRYEGSEEALTTVIDALVRQEVLRVRYYGLAGEGKDHRFEPYTLASYKGGLYLLGKSDQYEHPHITLAIERIDTVEKERGDQGDPVSFEPPPDYSPERHFQGLFGIIEGDEEEVVLEIQNWETEARLREREIHPTQRFDPARPSPPAESGKYRKAKLRMRVRGTEELVSWILGYGPWLRVVKPAQLKKAVEERLASALRLYEE